MENEWTRERERLTEINKKLLEGCRESLQWFVKLAIDHDGDYIADNVMRHHAKVSSVIEEAMK